VSLCSAVVGYISEVHAASIFRVKWPGSESERVSQSVCPSWLQVSSGTHDEFLVVAMTVMVLFVMEHPPFEKTGLSCKSS
jgi:hypothetical protein